MTHKENPSPNQDKLPFEITQNGDLIKISGDMPWLIELGAKIYLKLGGEDWKEEEARGLL